MEETLGCKFVIDRFDKKLFELPNVWLLLKDDVVDCGGGKRGEVVKLLDSGGRVLPDGLDEKGILENEL